MWVGKGGGSKGGAPKGGAPKGGAPKGGAPKGGAPKGGAPKGGAPNGGGPKFRAFFSLSRHSFHSSIPTLQDRQRCRLHGIHAQQIAKTLPHIGIMLNSKREGQLWLHISEGEICSSGGTTSQQQPP